jgi:hypothetical protein
LPLESSAKPSWPLVPAVAVAIKVNPVDETEKLEMFPVELLLTVPLAT